MSLAPVPLSTSGVRRVLRGRVPAAAAALVLLCGSAMAQSEAPDPAAEVQPEAPQPPGSVDFEKDIRTATHRVDVKEYAARSLARLAMLDLRIQGEPQPRDYRVATLLLGLALRMTPDDTELLRRQIEAARGAGDDQTLLASTRRLVELDPSDTVAQLRLITGQIASAQTVEARLAMYQRFLGPAGAKIDPSVRSRLALDSALLRRETGDDSGFARDLGEAIRLDPTHKEAVVLAATFYAARAGQRRALLELGAAALNADPLDPNIHFAIARELARGAAFRGAVRFFGNAVALISAEGGQPSDEEVTEGLILRWQAVGSQAIIAELDGSLTALREQAQRRIDELKAAKLPLDEAKKPEEVRLPKEADRVRMLAADAIGDRLTAEAALLDYENTVQDRMVELLDPAKRPETMTEVDAQQEVAQSVMDVQLARLWLGVRLDSVDRVLGQYEQVQEPGVQSLVRMMRAWQKLRAGDIEGGVAGLEEFRGRAPFGEIGLALAAEARGDRATAVEGLRRLARGLPTQPSGAWARARLLAMGEDPDEPDTAELESFAASMPAWIDQMIRDPASFMTLRAEVVRPVVGSLDRSAVRISLRNKAPVALGLGADRPISSRFLLAPRLEANAALVLEESVPEVVTLDRRLRLNPREELSVVVWPDAGETGLSQELRAGRQTRVVWRVLQGFRADPSGTFTTGPLCLSSVTGSQVRVPLPESRLGYEELMRRVLAMPAEGMPVIASLLRSMMLDPGAWPDIDGEQRSRLVVGLAQRYSTFPPEVRSMLVTILPHERLAPSMAPFDEAVRAETDPAVLAVVLVTRVADASDPTLERALRSSDPMLSDLARVLAERLGEGRLSYATFTAGEASGGATNTP